MKAQVPHHSSWRRGNGSTPCSFIVATVLVCSACAGRSATSQRDVCSAGTSHQPAPMEVSLHDLLCSCVKPQRWCILAWYSTCKHV
jgi:hypothetical protein